MKHEPSSDLLQFLRSKNILPNGYFSLEEPDGTYTFYSVSRSGVLYTLDLEPAALSADDVWEKLDRIQKISREVFEQAQESLWDARRLARGLPTSRELKPVAEQFYKDCAYRVLVKVLRELERGNSEFTLKNIHPFSNPICQRILVKQCCIR